MNGQLHWLRNTLMVGVALGLMALSTLAQDGTAYPSAPAKTTTSALRNSIVRGSVIRSDSGKPIRHAQVELIGERGDADKERPRHSAMTNQRGEFVFNGIGPGRYIVVARLPASLPRRITQPHPRTTSTPPTALDRPSPCSTEPI